MKTCAKCGGLKPYAEFHRDSRKSDGRRSRCRTCVNAEQINFQRKHKAETGRYYSRNFTYERTCEACGVPWKARAKDARYCSVTCSNRTRRYEHVCEECGAAWTNASALSRHCSPACARLARFTKELELWQPQPWWSGRLWPLPPASRCWYAGRCKRCEAAFVVDHSGTRYCSKACARSDAKARRRARKKNAYVADVSRTQVFVRDRWICQLCHRKVNPRVVVPHPKAPVLDHIVPLDRGGTHEPANVHCAHFLCNSIKGSGGGGEQLLLIG